MNSLSNLDVDVDQIVVSHADLYGAGDKFSELKAVLPDVPIAFCSLSSSEYGPIEPQNLSGPIEPNFETGPMGPNNSSGPIEPKLNSGPMGPLKTSGLIDNLKSNVVAKYREISGHDPILVARHRASIESIFIQTQQLQDLMLVEEDVAILSSELNLIGTEISQLIGIITIDDVLSSIFSNFCIGK